LPICGNFATDVNTCTILAQKNRIEMPFIKTHYKDYQVNSYEADANLNLKLNCLFQWFSEIAWEHASALGVGFEALSDTKRIWVLSGINVQLYRMPQWQEKVKLETWPSGISGLHYTRDFKLSSENGEPLAAACSAWVIFDTVAVKPVVPEEFNYLADIRTDRALGSSFSKVRPQKDLKSEFKEIAKYTDIDMHNHVNNAVYARWIEDCLGNISPERVSQLNIQYINQVKLGDNIEIFMDRKENRCFFEAKLNNDKTCFRAEVDIVEFCNR